MSILEIKLEKIRNKNDKDVINKEYLMLKKTRNINIQLNKKTKQLIKEIKKINLVLWNIEDEIRNCEKEKNFGKKFVELARSVYLNNDKRAKIKSEINEIFGSNIKEIKLYADY
jgi:adenine C2-methylase RlmN of 23S rRNA A2503 and tRNA A37